MYCLTKLKSTTYIILNRNEVIYIENLFQLALLQNQVVAFTYQRLHKSDLQEDLNLYDIQSSDDGFDPKFISDYILVNHWGSLISKEPLLFNSKYLEITDNNPFEIVDGYNLTLYEFINLSNNQIEAIKYKENLDINQFVQTL